MVALLKNTYALKIPIRMNTYGLSIHHTRSTFITLYLASKVSSTPVFVAKAGLGSYPKFKFKPIMFEKLLAGIFIGLVVVSVILHVHQSYFAFGLLFVVSLLCCEEYFRTQFIIRNRFSFLGHRNTLHPIKS